VTTTTTENIEALSPLSTHFESVDEVIGFLSALGAIPSEPGLVELDHALQCAAELKAIRPDDLELQVAWLVHDICHGRCHIREHDRVGAEAIRPVFGNRVAELVGLHVEAKRYLVATDISYTARLSPVSIETLKLQGESMAAEEIAAFEANPHAQDACLLRIADDAAKEPGRCVPGLDTWIDTLRRVAVSGQ
jgi:predicted HD phosphohydrolase